MHVVLVGGCGFIGHNLAVELKRHGHDVVVIDSLMINNLYAVNGALYQKMLKERLSLLEGIDVPLIRMDARDYSMLSETIAALEPDCIVHLAAVAHMDRSDKTPYTTFDHSLRTLENALDAAVNTTMPKFIYFSSSTVYGDWLELEMSERADCNPKNIYGSLKLCGELMVRAYTHAKGLDHIIIRPSALYGPRCVSGRVLQKFIEQARAGEALTVKGNGRLDFTYVKDLVYGTRLAIESDIVNETFNLTRGWGESIGRAADLIKEAFPSVSLSKFDDAVPGEPKRGTLDIKKARQMLGYEPKWNLEKGLADYIDWYRRFDS